MGDREELLQVMLNIRVQSSRLKAQSEMRRKHEVIRLGHLKI
jgi:hypothetical protein